MNLTYRQGVGQGSFWSPGKLFGLFGNWPFPKSLWLEFDMITLGYVSMILLRKQLFGNDFFEKLN